MKIGTVICAIALSASMAVGVGVAVSATNVQNASPVVADQAITDSTLEIRFTRPSDWGNNTVCIHTYDSGGTTNWPGYAMTYLWDNQYGQSVWSWSPSTTEPLRSTMIFNNNNNSMQSDAISAPSTSQMYWYYNGWQNADVETMDIYLYDYDNIYNGSVTVHAWRNGTSFANDTWPGIAAAQSSIATNGLIYKFTMSNRYDRVIFSNNGSNQTGDLTPAGNYTYVKANDDTQLDGKNTWWDNINYVYAHNFSQNTMLMRSIPTSDKSSTPYCAERYAAAKIAFNTIKNSDIGSLIINELNSNFADAMSRLSAWAEANHESFNSSTNTLSSNPAIVAESDDQSKYYILIAIIALASISTFISLVIIKRKRNLAK